jgi:elongation factor P--(R)-beta-lysine ligase
MQIAKCKMQSAKCADEDFAPAASWPALRRRAELLRELREFFHQHGFLEVETPILSADIVVDRHLDPFSTVLADDPRRPEMGRRLYLQTSPEFGMKRLMAASGEPDGATAICQVSRVFRNGECGRLHNPEFTMVEWYRVGDDMAAGMALLSDLCDALLHLGPAECVSYRAAFLRWTGTDPLTADGAAMAAVASERGLAVPEGLSLADRDAWLELLFAELVQPSLGRNAGDSLRESQQLAERVAHTAPVIVYDFPASQGALARVRAEEPPVAERFELFVRGIELANGYHELLDPAELRRRAAAANTQRAADGKPRLPEESRLLTAMERGLPACSGVALGFDRLVMVALGAERIDDVMAFPMDRA